MQRTMQEAVWAEKFLRAPFLSSAKTERVWSTSKNQDAVTKIIDMAPDLISRFFTGKKEEDGYTAESETYNKPRGG